MSSESAGYELDAFQTICSPQSMSLYGLFLPVSAATRELAQWITCDWVILGKKSTFLFEIRCLLNTVLLLNNDVT